MRYRSPKVNIEHCAVKSHIILDFTLNGQVLNWVESTDYLWAITVSCPHTGVPYNPIYGWNRPNVKAQYCSLFTYSCLGGIWSTSTYSFADIQWFTLNIRGL